MKPFYDKSSLYSNFTVENKSKDPKFKVVHHVKISVYKNISANFYKPCWSEENFVIKKDENTVTRAYVMENLNREK